LTVGITFYKIHFCGINLKTIFYNLRRPGTPENWGPSASALSTLA